MSIIRKLYNQWQQWQFNKIEAEILIKDRPLFSMSGQEDINLLDDTRRYRRMERNINWVRSLSAEYMYCASHDDMSWIEYYKRIYGQRIRRLWLVMSGHIRATGLKFQLQDEKQKTSKLKKELKDKEQATSILEEAVKQYRKAESEWDKSRVGEETS